MASRTQVRRKRRKRSRQLQRYQGGYIELAAHPLVTVHLSYAVRRTPNYHRGSNGAP